VAIGEFYLGVLPGQRLFFKLQVRAAAAADNGCTLQRNGRTGLQPCQDRESRHPSTESFQQVVDF